MKKNTFLWILVALVIFFFVFGMGKSVYEGFGGTKKPGESCGTNSDCEHSTTRCGVCSNGFCSKGMLRSLFTGRQKCPGHSDR